MQKWKIYRLSARHCTYVIRTTVMGIPFSKYAHKGKIPKNLTIVTPHRCHAFFRKRWRRITRQGCSGVKLYTLCFLQRTTFRGNSCTLTDRRSCSLVNQPYFLGGGANRSGHTCTTLLAGRNFCYVIIQITLTAKTNFRYVKNVFTRRSKFLQTEQTYFVSLYAV